MRLRWILISYFLIAGGVALALLTLGLAWHADGRLSAEALATLITSVEQRSFEPGKPLPVSLSEFGNVELAMALTYATGVAFGAFFAGRASPHRSYIEPALAAALVVGSFLLTVYLTPMGKIFIGLTGGHLERLVSILAGAGIVAGLVGATLGELVDIGASRPGVIRETLLAGLITIGALWSSAMIVGLVYANEVAKQAIANLANPDTRAIVEISIPRLAAFAGLAVACAAAAAGLTSQLAARRRAIVPIGIAAFAVFAAGGAALAVIPRVSDDLVTQIAAGAGIGTAIVAVCSAHLTWFLLAARR